MTKVKFIIGKNHKLKVFEADIDGDTITKIPLEAFDYELDAISESMFDDIINGTYSLKWYDKREIKDRQLPPAHFKEINTGSVIENLKEAQAFEEETGLIAITILIEEV